MRSFRTYALLWLGSVSLTQSFVPQTDTLRSMTFRLAHSDKDSSSAQDDKTELPLLPHFGASSQSTFNPFDGTLPHLAPPQDELKEKPFVASRKMELQYTCNICETRNCHKVSRIAYRKGVVIATCKGCGSQHLISDNLGFTNLWNEEDGTIEDYFANKGMEDKVNRVSKDVFDLEKALGHDSDSGSIVGEDGKPAME